MQHRGGERGPGKTPGTGVLDHFGSTKVVGNSAFEYILK